MKRIVVIGGGFFGLYLSEYLSNQGHKVFLFEKEAEFMSRASYVNQARVHNGYHYPRSILTALRSRMSFPRFVREFGDCIDSEFEKFYLISTSLSKVSSKQFEAFCKRIDAPCKPALHRLKYLINMSLIENCFETQEYAFDAIKLRDTMIKRIEAAGVKYNTNTKVNFVKRVGKYLRVSIAKSSDDLNLKASEVVDVDHVFNCTYSGLNKINNMSGLEVVPLKHEMTEMCLVEVPDEIKKMGLTVMCGPFFSTMPFPSTKYHSFSHVRYTPHYEWYDRASSNCIDSSVKYRTDQRNSAWKYMIHDAARYMPILSESKYIQSIWEVKTILPRSETDDSRPILFLPNHSLRGFHCIMGGKIDNVYDVLDAIEKNNILER